MMVYIVRKAKYSSMMHSPELDRASVFYDIFRRAPHLRAEQDVVCALHAQHERVVLVAHFILVAAKATTRPDSCATITE